MAERFGPQRPNGFTGEIFAAQDAFPVIGTPEILSIFPASPRELETAVVIRGNNFLPGQPVLYGGLTVTVTNVSQGTGPSGEDEITCNWPRIAVPGSSNGFNADIPLTVGSSGSFQVQTSPFYPYVLTAAKDPTRAAFDGIFDNDTLVIGTDYAYAQAPFPVGVDGSLFNEGFINGVPGTVIAGQVPTFTFQYLLWDGTWSNLADEVYYQGVNAQGTAAGNATAAANARTVFQGAGTAAGSSTASANGIGAQTGSGTAAGGSTASANGIIQTELLASGTAAGGSSATASSEATFRPTVQANGTSAASAVAGGDQPASGTAAGSSSASALAAAFYFLSGQANGNSTATGNAIVTSGLLGSGTANGTSTANVSLTIVIKNGSGTAAGTSTARASPQMRFVANGLAAGASVAAANGIIPGTSIGDIDLPGVLSIRRVAGVGSEHIW